MLPEKLPSELFDIDRRVFVNRTVVIDLINDFSPTAINVPILPGCHKSAGGSPGRRLERNSVDA